MNYLAHLFLSGSDDNIMFGNFIADEVKGSSYLKFNTDIQKGIIMHRAIDAYTDKHPIYIESKKRMYPVSGKFSGVVIDIIYDHFLASNWIKYSTVKFEFFIYNFYFLVLKNYHILPSRLKMAFPYMVLNKWFILYSRVDGIENVLLRMSKNTILPDFSMLARKNLEENYNIYQREFELFMGDVIREFR